MRIEKKYYEEIGASTYRLAREKVSIVHYIYDPYISRFSSTTPDEIVSMYYRYDDRIR
jgi:hypothetical protein